MLAITTCVRQKDVIRADAKCQTHIACNDIFPVHRELLKDGILLCLQNCIFHPLYTTIATQQDHNRTTIVTHKGLDHFLTRCLWQKDVIRSHTRCHTHIAHYDFFPVDRQLVKDGILLSLQNCIFELPSYRIEAAFGSNNLPGRSGLKLYEKYFEFYSIPSFLWVLY